MTIRLDTALALELYMRLGPDCIEAAQHQATLWLQEESRRLVKLEPGVHDVLKRILANEASSSVPNTPSSVGYAEMSLLKE